MYYNSELPKLRKMIKTLWRWSDSTTDRTKKEENENAIYLNDTNKEVVHIRPMTILVRELYGKERGQIL